MERSKKFLTGLGNQYYRATYKSMGFTSLALPILGVSLTPATSTCARWPSVSGTACTVLAAPR